MERADFEVPVKSPLPYIAALISAAALFFATFLIFPAASTADIAHTISPDEITYTYRLFFRYSEGIPFYDACFLFTYAALAALCFIPAAKKNDRLFSCFRLSAILSPVSRRILRCMGS